RPDHCGIPFMQSLKRCTCSWPTRLRPPSPSRSSLPTSSWHLFSIDGFCAARAGAARATSANVSTIVLIFCLLDAAPVGAPPNGYGPGWTVRMLGGLHDHADCAIRTCGRAICTRSLQHISSGAPVPRGGQRDHSIIPCGYGHGRLQLAAAGGLL